MSATADLRSEHVGVRRMLGIMDAMARRLRAGEQVPASDFEGTIEFLRVFVDKCHHTKEEKLLFPAMLAADIASSAIAILRADHDRGREAVTRIANGAQRMAEGDKSVSSELAEAILGYTELLQAHIVREERDCFDAADHELPLGTQEKLVTEYERVEREVVGEGRHEAFHAMLDQMSQAYHL